MRILEQPSPQRPVRRGPRAVNGARPAGTTPSSRLDYVDTRQGTDSHFAFSRGNTIPLTTMPHGMIGWTPQTDEGRWIFDRRAPKIQGFRGTHQPSPWIADYGQFLIMVSSDASAPDNLGKTESSYSPAETIAQPHYFRTRLDRHGIVAEMTPTERGASFRFTYTRGNETWISFKPAQGEVLQVDRDRRLVIGVSTANQGGVTGNFRCHFVAEIGAAILETGRYEASSIAPGAGAMATGMWVRLKRPRDGVVTVKIATSFINSDQALLNLRRELGRTPFAATLERARKVWEEKLGVIDIDGATEEQRQTFYRCLYRCFLFPRQWHEYDAAGKKVHFSPFDGQVHPGPLYTDCGFWDVHRTLLPLLTIIAPDTLGEMIEGWLNAYREGRWLPNWASPGYRECMVGSHGSAVIADAWLKGIRSFDPETALAAMIKDATVEPPSPAYGRTGVSLYQKIGYVPSDRASHSVARTTDYAHCDFVIDRFARSIGRGADTREIAARAGNYRNVFDPKTGFLRGRLADGSWRTPFSEFSWSSDYIEGSAWQHTWAVPHDAAGLIKLMGGNRRFVAKLDRMLALPAHFETGYYTFEIHEMTEMAAAQFGQYAHSNQPVHHALYLYSCAGRPDRTQHWVRRIMDELYTPERFPGDEDNGEMSAWYVLSALGIYPLCCGHPGYVLGGPRFPRATIRRPGGNDFSVVAKGDVAGTPFVDAVRLNARPFEQLEIPHDALVAGGELVFAMTDDARRAAARGQLTKPFSASTHA
ncbi:MAG TPA: GH92 family glycosyl hydrolase [Opitutaceae bacterium]